MGVLTKIVIGLVGAGAVLWGVNELRLSGAASDTPTRMTCKELGEKGAAGNAHVVLTDFVLTGDLVYEHGRKSSDTSKWKKVWVPAVPSDSEYARAVRAPGAAFSKVPAPRPVNVIVVSSETKNEAELTALGAQKELDGMVVNLISTLGHEEKKLLEESYGDVSRAQIFEVGRRPANRWLAIGAIVAGAGVGFAILRSFFRRRPSEAAPPAAA
jgi:hypothetical protein